MKTLSKTGISFCLTLAMSVALHAADPVGVTSSLDHVGTYRNPLGHVGATGLPPVGSQAQYSLDSMRSHPYNSAGTLPGAIHYGARSSTHFAPGYGYQPPHASYQINAFPLVSPYASEYQFGNRIPRQRNFMKYRGTSNAYGGPWYQPGASTNTARRGFSW